jgi:hypothetical protein
MFQDAKSGASIGRSETKEPWQDRNRCRPASAEERVSLFNEFNSSAFRLENLDIYAVESERSEYAAYLLGDATKKTCNTKWADYVRGHCKEGKHLERIHIIPRVLTDYLKYEIDWGYRYSSAAGEKIFFAYRDQLPSNLASTPLPDFWLFDEKTCLIQRYDSHGAWLGGDILESPSGVTTLRNIRDEIRKVSFPLNEHPHVKW